MVQKILIIEDDVSLQQYVRDLLLDHNYLVETASDGLVALSLLKKSKPDLVILDLGLPKITGEAVCAAIRKEYPQLPIVILTGKDTPTDIVNGLNLGADDYITKPFDSDILVARVKARLRNVEEEILQLSDLTMNSKTLEVSRNQTPIDLTPQEFKLLEYLLGNKGRVLSREMILNRVWQYSYDVDSRVVDVYIGYLRKKIDEPFPHKLIHSVRGFGYVMKE